MLSTTMCIHNISNITLTKTNTLRGGTQARTLRINTDQGDIEITLFSEKKENINLSLLND